MPGKSRIEWCTDTWNPVTGCSKVSPGCENCYAEAIALRFGRSTKPWTRPNAEENVQLHPERLEIPFKWRRPRRIFVNSVSDLFHELVPDGFIAWVWLIMAQTPWHTYQILTKRPERMSSFVQRWADLSGEPVEPKLVRGPQATRDMHPSGRGQLFAAYLDELGKTVPAGEPLPGAWPTFDWAEGPRWWPRSPLSNVWLGTSVEDQRRAEERIPHLGQTPAAVRFLSCEPLLGPLDLREWLDPVVMSDPIWGDIIGDSDIDWVITGGESGPGHRPIEVDWVRSIRDQCQGASVAFFHKQWGGLTPKSGGRELDGRTWDEFPAVAS